MYYKVVEKFGPESGDSWQRYLEWRGLSLTRFDSVDCILRPDLFEPNSTEDWLNCVNEDLKINLITNFEYAKRIYNSRQNAAILGVDIDVGENYCKQNGLIGFDIIDGDNCVSLITNWGTDEEGLFSRFIMSNGLMGELDYALHICRVLRREFPEDPHTEDCKVWAIYAIDSISKYSSRQSD